MKYNVAQALGNDISGRYICGKRTDNPEASAAPPAGEDASMREEDKPPQKDLLNKITIN